MEKITFERLNEAKKQIESIIRKINAIDKTKLGKSQLTLICKRVDALELSLQLIQQSINHLAHQDAIDAE